MVKGMTSCRPPESEISNEKSNESEISLKTCLELATNSQLNLQLTLQPTCNLASNDCISRRAAIDAMKSISDSICEQQAIDALCELPSAQPDLSGYSDRLWKAAYERGKAEAQPDIIHCGECKHRIEHKHYGDLGESAYTCEGNMGGWILPDGFCSLAEREANGN